MDILDTLNRDALALARDPKSSGPLGRMIAYHVESPWVGQFKSLVLAPLKADLEEFFEREIFQWEGHTWFYPSFPWWQAHAKTSHPPGGAGCSAPKHIEFLSAESPHPEFLYAHVLQDGSAYILGSEDFNLECDWWVQNLAGHSW